MQFRMGLLSDLQIVEILKSFLKQTDDHTNGEDLGSSNSRNFERLLGSIRTNLMFSRDSWQSDHDDSVGDEGLEAKVQLEGRTRLVNLHTRRREVQNHQGKTQSTELKPPMR